MISQCYVCFYLRRELGDKFFESPDEFGKDIEQLFATHNIARQTARVFYHFFLVEAIARSSVSERQHILKIYVKHDADKIVGLSIILGKDERGKKRLRGFLHIISFAKTEKSVKAGSKETFLKQFVATMKLNEYSREEISHILTTAKVVKFKHILNIDANKEAIIVTQQNFRKEMLTEEIIETKSDDIEVYTSTSSPYNKLQGSYTHPHQTTNYRYVASAFSLLYFG